VFISVIVATPEIFVVPLTSRVAIGLVVPMPTDPDVILKNVVVSDTSKFPTLKESEKNASDAVKNPTLSSPDITASPMTSNFLVGVVVPIPTLSVS
jgi:hypothetical protein